MQAESDSIVARAVSGWRSQAPLEARSFMRRAGGLGGEAHRDDRPGRCSGGRLGALLILATALSACALGQRDTDAVKAAATTAGSGASGASGGAEVDASRQGEPRYIRYRAEETGLLSAIDDSANTYLEFGAPPDAALTINDQDGRALVWTRVGAVIAIAGLHQGVLLRQGERASFLSPNPRWQGRIAMTLPARADYAEARARLENQALLQSAMQRALLASAGRPGVASGADAGSSGPATAPIPSGARPSSERPAPAADPVLQPGMTRSASASLAPLTTANLSASAADQGLIRVFFASASRSIVAPDDGLATLLREAPEADEVRITGFTDSIGPKDVNLRLAQSRADAVAQILYRRGVPGSRISVDAVASDEFIAENNTDRGRALNRRAEVVLIKNGRLMPLGAARR